MAYSDFTLARAREVFGLSTQENRSFFVEVAGIQPLIQLSILLKR